MIAAQSASRQDRVLQPRRENLVAGSGEMAELVRLFDWSSTALGPLVRWSETLLAAVNLVLASPIPSSLYWGPDHTLIYNDQYRIFTGARHPDALGCAGSVVWKEAWHIVGPQIEETFRTGETFHGDSLLVPILVDGAMQDRFWNYSFSPVYQDGRIGGVYNTSTNVTAAYRTACERDALAQRLEQVMESTSDGAVTIDRNWCFSYMNRPAHRATKLNYDLIGRNLWETLPRLLEPGSPNQYFYRRAMDHGESSEFEAFYPSPLNHWLRIQVRPAPDGIALFFRDITEEKASALAIEESAAALAASEEELRWTVALTAQLPFTADAAGKILKSGERILELTGQSCDTMRGDHWLQMMHPEDSKQMAVAWAHSVRTGEPYDIEHRVRTADGSYHWFRSRALARRDEAGKLLKWYGNSEDIDGRKKAEDALRTTEKLAAVGRLAASIAHEINNPLEAVMNLLYLASSSDDLSSSNREYIEAAERELRRAAVITNQTLRFHRQSTKPTDVTCGEILESCLMIFHGRLLNSNVETATRLRAVRPVSCFEGEIRQVLLNLAGNAIDAMSPRGGRLLLRVRQATDWRTGRAGLVVTVADTGSGISPAVQKKIFEPFFTTKGIAGTGLGLWVSQEIVARHGGRLLLRSRTAPTQTKPCEAGAAKVSTGTVFALFLPFAGPTIQAAENETLSAV